MKTITEKFTDEEHKDLSEAKKEYGKKINKEKISWHDFFIDKCLNKVKSNPNPFDFNTDMNLFK